MRNYDEPTLSEVANWIRDLSARLDAQEVRGREATLADLLTRVAPIDPHVGLPGMAAGGDVSLAGTQGAFPAALICGDASDGDVVIGADHTIGGDRFYNDLTVNAGIRLDTAGYRVFVRGTLTNNGYISNNGAPGAGAGAGAGGGAGTVGGGVAGGAGGAAGAAGTAGTTLSASFGGSGGSGGTAVGAGGVGGTANQAGGTQGYLRDLASAVRGILQDGLLATGGAGGGGGGGAVAGSGGGGGGGAGVCSIIARLIDNRNGVIEANGGDGFSVGAGFGGGGGGGGGGIVVLVGQVYGAGTVRANGGAGGTSPVQNGAAGAAGRVFSVTLTV